MEARLNYKGASFDVIAGGDYVRCALTKTRIPLSDLRYWSVARQEAYASAEIALEAELKARREKQKKQKKQESPK